MGELADIMAGKCDPNDAIELWDMEDRSGILLTLNDRPGVLNDALAILSKNNINMTSIQSRPPKTVNQNEKLINFNIALDFVCHVFEKLFKVNVTAVHID